MPIQDITPQTALQFGNTILVVTVKDQQENRTSKWKILEENYGGKAKFASNPLVATEFKDSKSIIIIICEGVWRNN